MIASWPAWLAATNSALEVESDTLSWRRLFQEMGPPFIIRVYPVWDQRVSVSPVQSASTQPDKTLEFCENHESSEWFDSKCREDKTKRVRQQACGSFLEIAHTY